MNVIAFGPTGGTGRALIEQGLALGHAMTAFARRPGETAAKVVVGDVFDADAVARAIAGNDAVMSALGTRPWRHTDVCSQGTATIASAMQAAGVRRIVAMSSQLAADDWLRRRPVLVW